jgi:hypothetical protein
MYTHVLIPSMHTCADTKYAYIHIHTYIHTHTLICTVYSDYIHTHIHTYTHTHTNTHICTVYSDYIHTHPHTHIQTHTYAPYTVITGDVGEGEGGTILGGAVRVVEGAAPLQADEVHRINSPTATGLA